MTDIGQTIFSTGTVKQGNMTIESKFLSIYKFDSQSNAFPTVLDIDNYIFNSTSKQVLVFSPMGNLFFTEMDSNGNLIKNASGGSFINPINGKSESYGQNYTNWEPIDYTKFTEYNSTIIFPQHFLSIPMNFGNGSIGSGYILYRDIPYSGKIGDNANYYLLYNPFNRNLSINSTPLTFATYCATIDFQDPACYCVDDKNHRCLYALAGSDSAGKIIQNLDISKASPSAVNSYNSLFANCGCNKICQNWAGLPLLQRKPTCSSINQNVICGINISASDKSKIELSGGIQTTQNCGANNVTTPTDNNSQVAAPMPNLVMPIVIAVIVIVVAFFGAVFFFKKMKS